MIAIATAEDSRVGIPLTDAGNVEGGAFVLADAQGDLPDGLYDNSWNPIPQRFPKKQDASLVRTFPDVRQDNHWRCGAACFAAVCQHFGVAMTVDEASKVLGTNVQRSTDPAAIVRELRKRGIAARPKKGMTVEQLAECANVGLPVIVCLQDYGERREEGASFAYGHYMVALEASHGVVIFQDPSIENAEREPGGDVPRGEADRSGNVAMPGRVVLDGERLMEVWHDQRANGEKLVRFGIACGSRTSKGIGAVRKGAGTCKPGERADLTGCQPSGGGGGASKPDNRGGSASVLHERFAEIGGKIEREIKNIPEARGRFKEAYAKVANVVKRLAVNETPSWALDLADQWVFEEVLNAAGRQGGVPSAVILTKAAAWGAAKAYLTTRKLVTGKAAGDRVEETILELLTAVAEAAGVDPPTAEAVRELLQQRTAKGNINPADVREIADPEGHGRPSLRVPQSLGNPDLATPARGKRTAPRNYMV